MDVRALLYPESPRNPQGLRWFRISCRSAHLVAIAGLVGGHVFDASREALHPWLGATLITGALLVATYLYGSFSWLHKLKGLAMAAKLVLVLLVPLMWDLRVWLLGAVILISGFSSHAPGRVRDWQPFGPAPRPPLRFGETSEERESRGPG